MLQAMQCCILVVAADPSVHERMVPLLAGAGHVVEEARSGGRALSLLRHGRFDVVLLDYQMPGVSSLALARTMRDLCQASGRSTAVVALARSPDDLVLHRGKDALFCDRACILDDPARLLAVVESSAALSTGVQIVSDLSVSRARAASAAIWEARGHRGRPFALVLPEPFPHQRETLDLCFDIDRPELAECILLLERHGVRMIPAWAERLPVIAVSPEAADVADALFVVEDEDSWDVVATLIADALPAHRAR